MLNLSKNCKLCGLYLSLFPSLCPQHYCSLEEQECHNHTAMQISSLAAPGGGRTGLEPYKKHHTRELSLFDLFEISLKKIC